MKLFRLRKLHNPLNGVRLNDAMKKPFAFAKFVLKLKE